MELTAENTAIVVDSTADFPQAPQRYSNWRIVPLYVRFGDESHRDYVDLGPAEFYERLRASAVTPTTSQPTPGDFAHVYRELAHADRIYSLHLAGRLSGTVESARTAAAEGRQALELHREGLAPHLAKDEGGFARDDIIDIADEA
jgi:DegV family protein with EDD domain